LPKNATPNGVSKVSDNVFAPIQSTVHGAENKGRIIDAVQQQANAWLRQHNLEKQVDAGTYIRTRKTNLPKCMQGELSFFSLDGIGIEFWFLRCSMIIDL
jgi:hypothetical protein